MASVIEEFLVGLGWKLDEASLRKFEEKTSGTRKGVLALGAAVAATAFAVEVGVRRMADRFESLYWASERTGASAKNIQALGYAMSQLGGNEEDAQAMLDSLASFMRSTPASEAFLNRLGVATRNATGGLRDTEEVLESLAGRFAEMRDQGRFYQAKAYAGVLGISEPELLRLMRGARRFSEEMLSYQKRAGFDPDRAKEFAKKLEQELRRVGMATGVLWDKAMGHLMEGRSRFAAKVGGWLDRNYESISKWLDWMLSKVDAAADAIMNWLDAGIRAAQESRFFEWITKEFGKLLKFIAEEWYPAIFKFLLDIWAKFFAWAGKQWEDHGQGIVQVLDSVLTWFKEAFFGALDEIGDYLGKAIHDALSEWMNWLPQNWKNMLGLNIPEEGHSDWELRRLRRIEHENHLKSLKEAIGDGINWLIPAAEANTEKPAAAMGRLSGSLAAMFEEAEKKHGLQSGLLKAIGWVESRFNPGAVSPAGARGLMQFMPGTARRFGIDPGDPSQSIDAAGRYMRILLDMFNGNLQRALQAYNWGEGNMRKWMLEGKLMPRETQAYAGKVMGAMSGTDQGRIAIYQNNEYHIAGMADAAAMSALERAQNRANASLARNMGGAVR